MEISIRHIISSDWIACIFVFCLILLTVLRYVNVVRFFDFLMLLSSGKYLSLQKQNKNNGIFTVSLTLIQILAATLLIYITYQTYGWETEAKNFLLFVQIAIAYMLFLIVKILIEQMVATIFSIDDLIKNYTFQKLSYRNYLGVIVLFVNLFLVYSFTPSTIVLEILFIVLAILNCISLFSIYRKHESVIYSNMFYFILYLCTLEIAPYFIVYKIFTL